LVSWSLTETIPPRAATEYSGYVTIPKGFGILRRTKQDRFSFHMEIRGPADVPFRVYYLFYLF